MKGKNSQSSKYERFGLCAEQWHVSSIEFRSVKEPNKEISFQFECVLHRQCLSLSRSLHYKFAKIVLHCLTWSSVLSRKKSNSIETDTENKTMSNEIIKHLKEQCFTLIAGKMKWRVCKYSVVVFFPLVKCFESFECVRSAFLIRHRIASEKQKGIRSFSIYCRSETNEWQGG